MGIEMPDQKKPTDLQAAFHDRLRKLIGEDRPFHWAKKVGLPASTFERVWNQQAIPKAEHLVRISEICGVSIHWLLTGQTEDPCPRSALPYINVPFRTLNGPPEQEAVPFAARFLKAIPAAIEPKHLFFTMMKSDMMEPTISDGDFVLFDRSNTSPEGLCVLEWDNFWHLRRVTRQPNAIILLADNPKYPPAQLQKDQLENVRIIGQVVWIAKTVV
jgi:phage repressor protein C with HTH and peptisase S24 domain